MAINHRGSAASYASALLAGVAVALVVLLASRGDMLDSSFRSHRVLPLLARANRSQCVAVDFEASRDSFAAVNLALDHARHLQLCERMLSRVDPLVLDRRKLQPLALSVFGATIRISPTLRRLQVSGLRTLSPLRVNATSPSSLSIGWRSTGVVTVEATVDVAVAQRDKRWWQPCWVSLWHPSSCPAHSWRAEFVVAVGNASGASEVRIKMLQCRADAGGRCHDLSAMDLVAAVLRGRPQELLLRVLSRVDRLSLMDFALELERVEHLRVHLPGASRWLNALVDGVAGALERRLNRKDAAYRAVLNRLRDALVASTNHAIGRWISPLFHGSCLDEPEDASTVVDTL